MALADWAPTVDAVGALLRARTRSDAGVEMGTFTSQTTPTADQVRELIGTAQGMVAAELEASLINAGLSDVPASQYQAARAATAIFTAMLVELSYFPNQVRTDRSAYQALADLYRERVTAVQAALVETGETGGTPSGGPSGGSPVRPVYGVLWPAW